MKKSKFKILQILEWNTHVQTLLKHSLLTHKYSKYSSVSLAEMQPWFLSNEVISSLERASVVWQELEVSRSSVDPHQKAQRTTISHWPPKGITKSFSILPNNLQDVRLCV